MESQSTVDEYSMDNCGENNSFDKKNRRKGLNYGRLREMVESMAGVRFWQKQREKK